MKTLLAVLMLLFAVPGCAGMANYIYAPIVDDVTVVKVDVPFRQAANRVHLAVKACYPIDWLYQERVTYFNDIRPSALIVSHPYPTDDPEFFKIQLLQLNQKTTRIIIGKMQHGRTLSSKMVQTWASTDSPACVSA